MRVRQDSVVISYAALELIPKTPLTKPQRDEIESQARSEVMKAIYTYLYTVDDGELSL